LTGLTLETIIESILNKDHWQAFDLHMSPHGFDRLSNELNSLDQRTPQVYVHVCDEGVLKSKVLRIGKAESGINRRWIKDTNGHLSTFLWSIGKSEKYTYKNAIRYPVYLLFFASLFGLNTKLYVLTCQSGAKGKGAARASEQALIACRPPIWESYRKYDKLGKNYPILSGKTADRDIHESVSELGGAYAAIKRQRSGEKPFSKPIPDLLGLGVNMGASIKDCDICNT
jgi:hypothetical protein